MGQKQLETTRDCTRDCTITEKTAGFAHVIRQQTLEELTGSGSMTQHSHPFSHLKKGSDPNEKNIHSLNNPLSMPLTISVPLATWLFFPANSGVTSPAKTTMFPQICKLTLREQNREYKLG